MALNIPDNDVLCIFDAFDKMLFFYWYLHKLSSY